VVVVGEVEAEAMVMVEGDTKDTKRLSEVFPTTRDAIDAGLRYLVTL
jgi:hypothetical protein